jgi:Zinc carboxypeptidase
MLLLFRSLRSSASELILLVVCVIGAPVLAAPPQKVAPVAPQDLAAIWNAEHVSPALPPLMDHDEVERRLKGVAEVDANRYIFERVGESVEHRSINMVSTGTGPFRVMLWSQMHGDEPTATAALFDVFAYLQRHKTDPVVQRILTSLTLYVIPMLNPDGAERFQRRNAQGIDINRDALGAQTPEGQVLKTLRDRFKPRVGFNLHNENWTTSVGDPPKPASISLLAVAYDKERSENAGRKLTKKICAVIRDSLEPFASGQIGKYDEDFETRAFGDNMTLWGTPIVLIETGGYPSSEPDPLLVRMNFIAIVSALDALATGSVDKADAGRYESLPKNESKEFYVLVKNATVLSGTGVPPFTADIGINVRRSVRTVAGRRTLEMQGTINDLGDLRTSGGLRVIDATGLIAAPLWDTSLKEEQEVDLPNWSRTPSARVLAPMQPGEIVLMRPLGDPSQPASRYVIQTILRY